MPSSEEVEQFKSAIYRKHPMLSHVYCVADGLYLLLQQAVDVPIQSRFCNGWNHDHYVGIVFAFTPNGKITVCTLNAPGCIHDSTIALYGDIYGKLDAVYHDTGGQCVVDSAFNRTEYPFLIKSSNTDVSAVED